MTPSHSHGGDLLYVPGTSFVHALAPEAKIVAVVGFVFAVVLTPAEQFWAFASYAGILAVLIAGSRVPIRVIAPRMLIEVPFVVFALLMPFFGTGPSVEVLGLTLTQAGLLAGWGILAKGTIGVVCAIVLAATTPARSLLVGLERLRVPPLLVQIASFMLRYTHVVGDEMSRMRLARAARGFEATGVRAWPVLSQGVAALFIRSYERGERVHLAMLSRGFTGRLPQTDDGRAAPADWGTALLLPMAGLVVATVAWLVQS